MADELVLTLPHKPSGDQWNYFNLNTRHTVGVIGRQYGKTTLAQLRAVKKVISTPNANHYWVAPIVSQARVAFDRMRLNFKSFVQKVNLTHMELQFLNGGWVRFKGSDNPANLKSDTLTSATLDECGTMLEAVWSESLRPMLAVHNGGCDFIGTPKGKNWFYNIFLQARTDPEFSLHHAPSNNSPFFSEAEFKSIRESTSEKVFEQEYLAQFLEEGSEVFRNFRECVKGQLEEPRHDAFYIAGIDLAKYSDWSVITIWDVERKHLVAFDRFNQIDWSIQEGRIKTLCDKYRARIRIDATGVGDPIYERLRKAGLSIEPVRFTSAVKEHLIESLVFAIEKREISFPHLPEIIQELSIFGQKKSAAGNVQYSAPPGYHDDIVISMALAVAGMSRAPAEFMTAD